MKKIVLLLFFLFGLLPSQLLASSYNIIDLGSLSGKSDAWGVNDSGQVVGHSTMADGNAHAFLWDNGSMTDLGTLGGGSSFARDINNAGKIVGYSQTNNNIGGSNGPYNRAVLWENGVIRALPTDRDNFSYAYSINNANQIVGKSYPRMMKTSNQAWMWDSSGERVELEGLGGKGISSAIAINDSGKVLGSSAVITGPSPNHIVSWDSGIMSDLGALNAWARNFNNLDQIVGELSVGNGNSHAMLLENGIMTDLGTLGGLSSSAWEINDSGHVVGSSKIAIGSSISHAFLWEEGIMTDLNDLIASELGWEIMLARDINQRGQIVGLGAKDGEYHAFLMTPNTPVPEPSTILLFGIGILCLAGVSRRKNNI